jgi:hypothetical protein
VRHMEAAAGAWMSLRHPWRPGWPLACVSSTGGMGRRSLPAHSPAPGMETVVPGATKCCGTW